MFNRALQQPHRNLNFRAILSVGLALAACLLGSSPLQAAATLDGVIVSRIAPRILTPNGDGFNDRARFELDNPEQVPVEGTIYDLTGARVTDLDAGVDVVSWDGRDSSGKKVAGGIYIYQLQLRGKTTSGTVVVAR